MSKILELVVGNEVERQADPEVVQFLERVLEDARSGKLTEVFIVGTGPGEIAASGWTPIKGNAFALLGAIANAQWEYTRREIEHQA